MILFSPLGRVRQLALVALTGLCALSHSSLIAAPKGKADKPEALKPDVELGAPFADYAILQRRVSVPVWGWATPNIKVTVEFAGQKKSVSAGADGKWMLQLNPMEASAEPREMTITESTGDKRVLKDLLVGEVWMASGQSNMQWMAGKSDAMLLIKKLTDGAKTAGTQLPPIREFAISDFYAAPHPIEHASGEWKNGNFKDYSAIAFSFAEKIYQELKIPIGILNCSFSQTSIETWTPKEGFDDGKDEETKTIYKSLLESDPRTPEHKIAWGAYYQQIEDVIKENAELAKNGQKLKIVPTTTPGNMRDNRNPTWMFNARLNPVIPYAIRGAIWNQGYANINGGMHYYNNLHNLIGAWRKLWNQPELPVYFHQFYCPALKDPGERYPTLEPMAEMRLGTWLARDIPYANMASQIDVEGAIHYGNKTVPSQRLALHALKNQYGKDIVTEGPMFKSYEVKGDQLIVEFDHAEGGLVVGDTATNTDKKNKQATGFSDPVILPNGDALVKLFYLAGEDRIWHPASMKIDGTKVIVSSPAVKSPRGVSYGTGGIGFLPNLYNQALLPATPFILFDHKLVTRKDWPDDPMKIAGVKIDPSLAGKLYEYRKMPLLAAEFRDDAILQADQPLVIWGSAIHDWGYEASGNAQIQFSFAGVEKTIPVTPGMKEWQVNMPAMSASAEPKTLKVTFTIDGELVHERVCKNILIGDVWYVSATDPQKSAMNAEGLVRVMTRMSKNTTHTSPRRYTVCTSTQPLNRFESAWKSPDGGFAAELGKRLNEKTGRPIGIIYMEGKDLEIKHWLGFEFLRQAPSLMEDYKNLATIIPGNEYYDANAKVYINNWKTYWSDYIPKMIQTRAVPDAAAWGIYPTFRGSVTTTAAQAYNVMVYPFAESRVKGVILFTSKTMSDAAPGDHFGEQVSALANSWKSTFGGKDATFIYTMPDTTLVTNASAPSSIEGKSQVVKIADWNEALAAPAVIDAAVAASAK